MHRRTFLQFAALTGALTGTLTSANKFSAQENRNADVIVIGAGAAGIAAADRLRRGGLSVIVLEGRDRIGGRVWTDRSLGVPVDLGASWIHGEDGNPLTRLARDVNARTVIDDGESVDAPAGWEDFPEDDEIERLWDTFDDIREDSDNDLSVREALEATFREMGLSARDLDSPKWRRVINSEVEHEYAGDIGDLSAWWFDDSEGFDGDDLLLPEGYDRLLIPATDALDIRLNEIVTGITYDRGGVRVTSRSGDFEARRVVITLPQGVLKSGSVQFEPPLPNAKTASIERMGMGLLNKTVLRFPSQFWDDALWITNTVGDGLHFTEGVNIGLLNGEPLMMWFNAAATARELERLSDAEMIAAAMESLRELYGADIPEPDAALITRWSRDPFAGGSYSYLPVGATPDDYDALAAPVEDVLFFAGEATNREHSATVHGAWLSGIRAADEVLDAE